MTKFLLAVHVLAAIVAVGPVTVAASMFPAAARRAQAQARARATAAGPDAGSLAAVRVLHRICRVYGVIGVAVPAFGFATASSLGVLTDTWLIVSIALTAAAAGVLALAVVPRQETLVDQLEGTDPSLGGIRPGATAQLTMLTGLFNLLWATVTVLMILRPGSTTSV